MQGRLSHKPLDSKKSFPIDNWSREIELLKFLNLKSMQWIFDDSYFLNNPFLNSNSGVLELLKTNDVIVNSAILNVMINQSFDDSKEILEHDFLNKCDSFFSKIYQNNINLVVIPFVSENIFQYNLNFSLFIELINELNQFAISNGIKIALEVEDSIENIKKIYDNTSHLNSIGFAFDMGNSCAAGNDPVEEIKLYGNRLWNVHVKDRTNSGIRVPIGLGDVQFEKISIELQKSNYQGDYIIEGYWQEGNPIRWNQDYVKFCTEMGFN